MTKSGEPLKRMTASRARNLGYKIDYTPRSGWYATGNGIDPRCFQTKGELLGFVKLHWKERNGFGRQIA